MNDFYVYGHFLLTGEIFYIGKGKRKRAYSKSNRNIHWKRKVAKHGGFIVVILQDQLDEDLAFEVEKSFISSIGLENLVNMTDGGEGTRGWVPSEETKNKMRESHIREKHPMFGKFGKDNPSSKSVNQYSKDGVLIRTWDSMMDIQRELKINQYHISKCCSGKRKTAGGFLWCHHIVNNN